MMGTDYHRMSGENPSANSILHASELFAIVTLGFKPCRNGLGNKAKEEHEMKRRVFGTAVLCMCLLLCLAVAVQADPVSSQSSEVIEQVGTNGKVNWTAGTVEATGIGAPPEKYYGKPQAPVMALRQAQLDAYRSLLEIIKGIRVDSTMEVRDFTTPSDTLRAQVEGLVKSAQIIRRDYMSDGTVEITVRMSLKDSFAQAVLPVVPAASQAAASQSTAPASAKAAFTGIVIDARGIQVRPAMCPKIIDENDQEVYGPMMVERSSAVQLGMSGYTREIGSAQTNPRVANNPITIKGIRASGPGMTSIVIANSDAEKLRTAVDSGGCMKKARVMIVLD